jgi:hypothetical protein
MLALAHKNSNSLNHYLDDLINGYLHTTYQNKSILTQKARLFSKIKKG